MAKLTKSDLVAAISEVNGVASKAAAGRVVNTFVDTITNALCAGDSVTISGLGTFSVADRAARTAIKPGTTEKIAVPAHKAVKFKAGKALKESVR